MMADVLCELVETYDPMCYATSVSSVSFYGRAVADWEPDVAYASGPLHENGFAVAVMLPEERMYDWRWTSLRDGFICSNDLELVYADPLTIVIDDDDNDDGMVFEEDEEDEMSVVSEVGSLDSVDNVNLVLIDY